MMTQPIQTDLGLISCKRILLDGKQIWTEIFVGQNFFLIGNFLGRKQMLVRKKLYTIMSYIFLMFFGLVASAVLLVKLIFFVFHLKKNEIVFHFLKNGGNLPL
jgi:hypothetical protein